MKTITMSHNHLNSNKRQNQSHLTDSDCKVTENDRKLPETMLRSWIVSSSGCAERITVCINVAAWKWSRNHILRPTASHFRELTFTPNSTCRWVNILFILLLVRREADCRPSCRGFPAASTALMTSLGRTPQGGNFMHSQMNQTMTVNVSSFTPGWHLCPVGHISFKHLISIQLR